MRLSKQSIKGLRLNIKFIGRLILALLIINLQCKMKLLYINVR